MKSPPAGPGRCRPRAVPNLTCSGARPDAIGVVPKIRIEDVARLFSRCRFTGRSALFHSTLQHDLLGSSFVPFEHGSRHTSFMPEGP